MSRRTLYIVLGLLLFFALLPLIGVLAASGLAGLGGCTLSEVNATPCLIAGRDVGPLLYSWFVGGWLMLVSLPVAGLLILILAIMIIGELRR